MHLKMAPGVGDGHQDGPRRTRSRCDILGEVQQSRADWWVLGQVLMVPVCVGQDGHGDTWGHPLHPAPPGWTIDHHDCTGPPLPWGPPRSLPLWGTIVTVVPWCPGELLPPSQPHGDPTAGMFLLTPPAKNQAVTWPEGQDGPQGLLLVPASRQEGMEAIAGCSLSMRSSWRWSSPCGGEPHGPLGSSYWWRWSSPHGEEPHGSQFLVEMELTL